MVYPHRNTNNRTVSVERAEEPVLEGIRFEAEISGDAVFQEAVSFDQTEWSHVAAFERALALSLNLTRLMAVALSIPVPLRFAANSSPDSAVGSPAPVCC
jgi:hypothetical protein